MKIKSRDNVKGNIVSVVEFENKNYIRIQKNKFNGLDETPITEWKNKKTNHIVNSEKSKKLEEMFSLSNETTKLDVNFRKNINEPGINFLKTVSEPVSPCGFLTMNSLEVDKNIIEYIKSNKLLEAVKYYKDISGVGLKEAKEYIDGINDTYKAHKIWEKGMVPTKDVQTIDWINRFFSISSISKESYILKTKDFYIKNYNNSTETVKNIKDVMGWGLYESKLFFDTFIK